MLCVSLPSVSLGTEAKEGVKPMTSSSLSGVVVRNVNCQATVGLPLSFNASLGVSTVLVKTNANSL